jgi:hypothetical protein
MPHDEGLACRIREILSTQPGIAERRMFGGLAFLFRGHLVVGIVSDNLMARVGPVGYEAALARPHARPMDFTGKPLTGFVFVAPPGFAEDDELARWLGSCLQFVRTLPPKPGQ